MKRKLESKPVSSLNWDMCNVRLERPVISGVDVFPTEDKEEFAKFRDTVFSELDPEDSWQDEIVLRICKLRWRLSRLGIFLKAEKARLFYRACLKDDSLATLLVYQELEQRKGLIHTLGVTNREIAKHRGETIKENDTAQYHPAPELRDEIAALLDKLDQSAKELEALQTERAPAVSPDSQEKGPGLGDKLRELVEGLNAQVERIREAPHDRQALAAILKRENTVLSAMLATTFGPSALARLQAEQERDRRYDTSLELAFFADVITSERYAEELKLAQAIEKELAQLMHMLRDLKKWKRKERKREISRSPLLPPYMRHAK